MEKWGLANSILKTATNIGANSKEKNSLAKELSSVQMELLSLGFGTVIKLLEGLNFNTPLEMFTMDKYKSSKNTEKGIYFLSPGISILGIFNMGKSQGMEQISKLMELHRKENGKMGN